MIVKAKKYGNSKVITIPSALWEFFCFEEGRTEFSMENENGQLVIRSRPLVDNSKLIEQALSESVEEHKDLLEILAK